jgi:hypothetical protein
MILSAAALPCSLSATGTAAERLQGTLTPPVLLQSVPPVLLRCSAASTALHHQHCYEVSPVLQ